MWDLSRHHFVLHDSSNRRDKCQSNCPRNDRRGGWDGAERQVFVLRRACQGLAIRAVRDFYQQLEATPELENKRGSHEGRRKSGGLWEMPAICVKAPEQEAESWTQDCTEERVVWLEHRSRFGHLRSIGWSWAFILEGSFQLQTVMGTWYPTVCLWQHIEDRCVLLCYVSTLDNPGKWSHHVLPRPKSWGQRNWINWPISHFWKIIQENKTMHSIFDFWLTSWWDVWVVTAYHGLESAQVYTC